MPSVGQKLLEQRMSRRERLATWTSSSTSSRRSQGNQVAFSLHLMLTAQQAGDLWLLPEFQLELELHMLDHKEQTKWSRTFAVIESRFPRHEWGIRGNCVWKKSRGAKWRYRSVKTTGPWRTTFECFGTRWRRTPWWYPIMCTGMSVNTNSRTVSIRIHHRVSSVTDSRKWSVFGRMGWRRPSELCEL